MSKSPMSATLPALSRSQTVTNTTTSGKANNSSVHGSTAAATGAAATAVAATTSPIFPATTERPAVGTAGTTTTATTTAAPAVDYVALYRQYCTEEGCKANSAFVRYIQDRGGHFSLERLNLGHNYLGSKGLRPVLRMIDLCQTIVSINLEDNGIGNDAVHDLCEVLERHVSCASLNLRRNPISVLGGKRLLQLAESNPRMMEILLDGTDVFEGLQERIKMALQHNAAVALGSGPQMEANKDDYTTSRGGSGGGGGEQPSQKSFTKYSNSDDKNYNTNSRNGTWNGATRAGQGAGGLTNSPHGRRGVASTQPPPPKASLQPLHPLSPSHDAHAGNTAGTAAPLPSAHRVTSASTTSSAGDRHGGPYTSGTTRKGVAGSAGHVSHEMSRRNPTPPPSLPGVSSTAAGATASGTSPTAVHASHNNSSAIDFNTGGVSGNGGAASAMNARLGWQEAAVSRTQPRPPAPAIASHASRALPMDKVIDLKALFAERARLHTEVNRGEASQRAYAVREELQALERHGRPISDSAEGVATSAGAFTGTTAAAAAAKNGGLTSNVNQTYPLSAGRAAASGSGGGVVASTTTTPIPQLPEDASAAPHRGPSQNTASNNSNNNRNQNPLDRPYGTSPVRTRANSEVEMSNSPLTPPPNSSHGNTAVDVGNVSTPLPQQQQQQQQKQQEQQQSESGVVSATSTPPPPPTRPLAHTVEDVLSPSRMMLLTTEEQFTVLFDQGCREYMNRNLDAAYMAWNEAMRLAVSEGHREWMAVVASNLQRLSYELLVEEGASYLEHGELEKAGETFNLALEVAVKAKNAAWERDMRLAKQNVQKALFHRCHEAALLLFSRAQEDVRGHNTHSPTTAATLNSGSNNTNNNNNNNNAMTSPNSNHANTISGGNNRNGEEGEVTEDDYFVLPGTEEMVRHTPAFVREWSCLLLLKEAIGLWVEGTRVVSRLSQLAAAPLLENITEALNLVASFIVQRHFNDTTPDGLLWFHTDAYLYHECVLLSDLWYDLVADSEQSLHHPLLSAICAAQLGELYVATFQLPQALVQLDKLVRYGHLNKCPVLEAAGLTLCGRVHLQRASHALAEAALEAALELWGAAQNDPVIKRLVSGNAEGIDGASGSGHVGLPHELAPMDAAAIAADMTNHHHHHHPTSGGSAAADNATALAATVNSNGAQSGTTNNNNSNNNGGLRFRIENHLPPDAITVLASACRHYKVCLLLQTYRYRDALETLEYSLNVAYTDTLQEKLGRNYHLNPSLDEITAIAGVLQTSLVFYTLTSRYDWSAQLNSYQVEESLCMWVLAESREMRFVEVNLTNNFKCTMRDLLGSLRQRLCVEPEMAMQSDIITELPSRSWQEPLRVLYQACIHPIIGYVRAADPQLLFGDGVITVVPTGMLWLVPFHALLNVKAGDRYLVEEVAIQLAFSATQAAFAALSAERVQQRDLHREVVAVQTDADADGFAESLFHTAFPLNADRSMREGEVVAAMLRAGQAQVAERQLKRIAGAGGLNTTTSSSAGMSTAANVNASPLADPSVTRTSVFTHKVEVVESVEGLRAVLPRARTLHIATATTSANVPAHLLPLLEERRGRQRAEDEGGLLLTAATSPMGDIGILRAADIAHMELFAEHVILTNTNMSREHVCGIRDDVLGLVRSFFGSGVPCVIAGQWCTPDMEPMELFQRFYTLWCRPAATSADASLRTLTQSTTNPTGASESRGSTSTSDGPATLNATNGQNNNAHGNTNNNNNSSVRSAARGGGVEGEKSPLGAASPNASLRQGHPGSPRDTFNNNNSNNRSDFDSGNAAEGVEDEGEIVRHRALLLARSIRRLLTEEPGMRYRPRVWAGYYCLGTGW